MGCLARVAFQLVGTPHDFRQHLGVKGPIQIECRRSLPASRRASLAMLCRSSSMSVKRSSIVNDLGSIDGCVMLSSLSLFGDQLNRTYSKSPGWLLMPRAGGAIQLANLPG